MSASKVKSIHGREIIDSRGNPTVEVELYLDNGASGRAAVPSGASTGEGEALELRDGEKRYGGKGVRKAVSHVKTEIAVALNNFPAGQQEVFDRRLIELDGTDNKARLGANALLGVSMAYARASAVDARAPLYQYLSQFFTGNAGRLLPVPMMNIINGGAHADNTVDLQEFMVMPLGFSAFSEALRAGAEIFHALKGVLRKRKLNTAVGDEGGFAPDLSSNRQALDVIAEAVEQAGYRLGEEVAIALDAASSEFYRNATYVLESETPSQKTAQDMIAFYQSLARDFPIVSIEDGLAEGDWAGWKNLTEAMGKTTQLVGDDLFVTNTRLLSRGIKEKVANAILIKVNQIGTVWETIEAIRMALDNRYRAVISHRSGETEDTFIADLAVASGAGQIKTGSLSRTDRLCKYNQLLRIEEALGAKAEYWGKAVIGAYCNTPLRGF